MTDETDKQQDDNGRFDWLKTANQLSILEVGESQAITDEARTEISWLGTIVDDDLTPDERSLIRKSSRSGSAIGAKLLADPEVRIPQPGEDLYEEWEWTVNNLATDVTEFGEAHADHPSGTIRNLTNPDQMAAREALISDKESLEVLLTQLHTTGVLLGHSGDDITRGRRPRQRIGGEALALISLLGRYNGGLRLQPQEAHDLHAIYKMAGQVKQQRLGIDLSSEVHIPPDPGPVRP